jgi:hypothetical protein
MIHEYRLRVTFSMLAVVLLLCSIASAEQKERVLYSFQGGTDGSTPAGGVLSDQQGNLYGATTDGGAANCLSLFQCGTVFELSPPAEQGAPWTETILHVFKGRTSGDGASPFGGLVIDGSGNLYGTTGYGGTGDCVVLGTNVGCGTVYQLTPPAHKGGAWTEKVLYNFRGDTDGQLPYQDLVFDKVGNLYGATQYGGGYGRCNAPFYKHCGTVFELSPAKMMGREWTEKVLHSFKGGDDGANPNGGLVLDKKGAIYGTTFSGGNQGCKTDAGVGCGVAFRLATASENGRWTERILYRFSGEKDGGEPNAGLSLNATGSLFGVAGGGNPSGGGIVFRLATSRSGRWKETVLHWFSNSSSGGPEGGVIFDSAGNVYGTTVGGDRAPGGTVFRLRPPAQGSHIWLVMEIYSFKIATKGRHPTARLFPGDKGNLYGTTSFGGTGEQCQGGCGTVFEILP